jgi:DedD protein
MTSPEPQAHRPKSSDPRQPIVIRFGIAVTLLIAVAIALVLLASGSQEQQEKPESKVPHPAVVAATETPKPAAVDAKPVAADIETRPPELGPRAAEGPIVSKQSTGDPPAEVSKPEAADPAEKSALPPKLAKGPYLQVGVFMHPTNAHELKARLEAQGIPVHLAMRVQVGPFKSKQEAELMRERLKTMGLESLLINQ